MNDCRQVARLILPVASVVEGNEKQVIISFLLMVVLFVVYIMDLFLYWYRDCSNWLAHLNSIDCAAGNLAMYLLGSEYECSFGHRHMTYPPFNEIMFLMCGVQKKHRGI